MTTRALLIVDVQNDFCEGGALAVAGGNAVAQGISDYLDAYRVADLVIASRDWHAAPPNDNCGHFALEGDPDYVTSWPVHCVQGTDGARLHPALNDVIFDAKVYKGHGTQSYSAFEGIAQDWAGTGLDVTLLGLLRSRGVTDIDVCGIATDYCVKASVLDALGTGFRVRVLRQLIAGVARDTSEKAIVDMMTAGATLVM